MVIQETLLCLHFLVVCQKLIRNLLTLTAFARVSPDRQRAPPRVRPLLRELLQQGRVSAGGGQQQGVRPVHEGGGQAGSHRGAGVVGLVLPSTTGLQLRGEY